MGNCLLVACSSGVKDDEIVGTTRAKDSKFVCRDDLNKKPSSTPAPAPAPAGIHHGRERRIKQVVGSAGGVTRVKIVLTKQEASLLLSNCKDQEGLLKFKLGLLQKIGTTFTTNPGDRRSWNPALESISEV